MTPRVTNAVLAVKMDSMDKNINDRIDQLAETVEKHDILLYGNGDDGIKTTVKGNSSKLSEIIWWIRLAFGAIILDLIARWLNLI